MADHDGSFTFTSSTLPCLLEKRLGDEDDGNKNAHDGYCSGDDGFSCSDEKANPLFQPCLKLVFNLEQFLILLVLQPPPLSADALLLAVSVIPLTAVLLSEADDDVIDDVTDIIIDAEDDDDARVAEPAAVAATVTAMALAIIMDIIFIVSWSLDIN
mmetsp:Transcript_18874/g.40846  ORF Transcript_18874/g.40846 Transcript_18874/m.40846 type:complete len:157 (+) Transcript_18874:3124-3594(+)